MNKNERTENISIIYLSNGWVLVYKNLMTGFVSFCSPLKPSAMVSLLHNILALR